ncbi:hypothetical protein [Psychrobacillus phage Perkons]|nr:hypothetical protein [Psychrobacillus phage Perkons]
MSTNYYFINKKSRELANTKNQEVNHLFTEFQYSLIGLGFNKDEVSDVVRNTEWKFEIKDVEIHIGKRSIGWKPLFQSNEYYTNMIGMKQWYENNKDEWIIENEYEEELTWEELHDELLEWTGEKTHIGLSYGNYYMDELGHEWTDHEFS